MELAAGVLIAGKYRLERPLAAGGMGAVWIARHLGLDALVALKFMDAEQAASTVSRARFEREARAAATLRNQHVVHVLDYGVEAGTPYLAMELLRGEDLRQRLIRERRLPLAVASRILTQAAKGLRTAHEAGVVHRDLKPANLFLVRHDGDDEEVVKILDFGIAKETLNLAAVGEGTRTGELMGSPQYMSPEQVRGARDLDLRSDLWSLSVILFRALTGHLPFTGEVIGAVIGAILADPVPVATRLAPDLPPAMDAFFERGFARNRDQRFQTAREMAEAFAAIVAGAGAGDASPRWSATDEPATRLRLPSRYPAELSGDLRSLPSPGPGRADLPSVPTESMIAESGMGTGGPVIHTAPPPPPARSPRVRWLPAVGALAGVLLGVTAFLALRTPSRVATAAGAETATATVAPAIAAPPPPTATTSPSTTASPSVTSSGAPPAAATVAATATVAAARASTPAVTATATSKAAARPASAPPTRPGAGVTPTKRPNWGF